MSIRRETADTARKGTDFNAVNGEHHGVLRDTSLEEKIVPVLNHLAQRLRSARLTRAPASMLTYKRHAIYQRKGIVHSSPGETMALTYSQSGIGG